MSRNCEICYNLPIWGALPGIEKCTSIVDQHIQARVGFAELVCQAADLFEVGKIGLQGVHCGVVGRSPDFLDGRGQFGRVAPNDYGLGS